VRTGGHLQPLVDGHSAIAQHGVYLWPRDRERPRGGAARRTVGVCLLHRRNTYSGCQGCRFVIGARARVVASRDDGLTVSSVCQGCFCKKHRTQTTQNDALCMPCLGPGRLASSIVACSCCALYFVAIDCFFLQTSINNSIIN